LVHGFPFETNFQTPGPAIICTALMQGSECIRRRRRSVGAAADRGSVHNPQPNANSLRTSGNTVSNGRFHPIWLRIGRCSRKNSNLRLRGEANLSELKQS